MRERRIVDNEIAAIADAQKAIKSLYGSWIAVERALLYLCSRNIQKYRAETFARALLESIK